MSRKASGVVLVVLAVMVTLTVFCGCSKKSRSTVSVPPDTTPPTTAATPPGGTYDPAVNVTLTSDEPALICFTTDGSTPTTTHYTGSGPGPIVGIPITATTTLKFFAIDSAGNQESVKTEEYVIAGGDVDAPVITSGPSVTGVGDSTATIAWTTDEASSSLVEYGLDASFGQTASNAASVTNHSITLTGLSPDTTYHFRAGSTDPYGNGPTWSSDSTFTTNSSADSDPPIIVTGPTVTGITNTAATVGWATDEVSDSVIEYGLDISYGQSESDTADVTDHSVTLTGLSADTTYHFRVGSTDPSDNGPTWSNDSTFTTTGGGPTPLAIITTSLPNGAVGTAYSATLAATGGTPSYTWSITGALPDGLNLDSGTGEISGTPSAPGTYNFTVEVTDSGTPSQNAAKDLSITIAGAEVTVTIGTGTTDRREPLDSWYDYGRCQMLFLKSEIGSGGGAAGQITKIRFNKASGEAWTYGTVTIYLNHTSETDLESTGWLGEGTLVFSGDLNVPSDNGWFEITLQTVFNYNNSDNLLVSVRHQAGSKNLFGPMWYNTTDIWNPDKCLAGSDDSDNPPSVSSTSRRPNIQFVINTP